MPRLSVLLPVRNAAPWLDSSLRSLWRQSWRDFEVIAVDDGSTDGSGAMLDAAAAAEPRLHVIHAPHAGLPLALNTAFARANGDSIARHDADDLSHRDRFAEQMAFLDSHPDVGVVGTRLRLFPTPGYGSGMQRWAAWHNRLLTHDDMRREAWIDSPLAHGTAMLRRSALESVRGWNESGWAEDLDLWFRLFERGVRFAKLANVRYAWRQHPGSSTRMDPRYARARFVELKIAALDRTLLSGGRRATLAGTGESLRTWNAALGQRVKGVVECCRDPAAALPRCEPPLLIVLTAASARRRWREAIAPLKWRECEEFVFVS